jgi:hypothetical protein
VRPGSSHYVAAHHQRRRGTQHDDELLTGGIFSSSWPGRHWLFCAAVGRLVHRRKLSILCCTAILLHEKVPNDHVQQHNPHHGQQPDGQCAHCGRRFFFARRPVTLSINSHDFCSRRRRVRPPRRLNFILLTGGRDNGHFILLIRWLLLLRSRKSTAAIGQQQQERIIIVIFILWQCLTRFEKSWVLGVLMSL